MDTTNAVLKRSEITKLLRLNKFHSKFISNKIMLALIVPPKQLRQLSDGLLKSHRDGPTLPTREQCGIQDRKSQEHEQVKNSNAGLGW